MVEEDAMSSSQVGGGPGWANCERRRGRDCPLVKAVRGHVRGLVHHQRGDLPGGVADDRLVPPRAHSRRGGAPVWVIVSATPLYASDGCYTARCRC